MLRSISTYAGCTLAAKDGEIGRIDDFLFEDGTWIVRYLVVVCGSWLSGRKVLISPRAIGRYDAVERRLHATVTQDEVRCSPDIDPGERMTPRKELQLSDHYGYPVYWGGSGYWGIDRYPNASLLRYGDSGSDAVWNAGADAADGTAAEVFGSDRHFRSCRTLEKYYVDADDGDVGLVDGMLVDDQTWAICQLIVSTSQWWEGHRVLVATSCISTVSWTEAAVSIRVKRDAIKDALLIDDDPTTGQSLEADADDRRERPAAYAFRRVARKDAAQKEATIPS